MNTPETTLQSEAIILAAPMSLTGSAQRIWRGLVRPIVNAWARWLLAIPLALTLILGAWAVIVCWYAMFGIFLVPYRLIRRGQRKRKLDGARQREVIDALRRQER